MKLQPKTMKPTLLRTLPLAGLILTAAACGLQPAGQLQTPVSTPTQVNVSTPFTLPAPVSYETPAGRTPSPKANNPNVTALPTHLPAFSKTLFFTPGVPATRLPGECDQAGPGNPIDVTIPDYTEMAPGSSFTKIWRLVNTGPCAWTEDYSAVWFSGESFGAPLQVALNGGIAPGGAVDIAVDMVAPEQAGTYQSNWKLSNDQGGLFGIGPAGDSPIWVRIVVVPAEDTPTPPAATLSPTPVTLVSGLVTLQPGESLDLDTNRISLETDSDLTYLQGSPGEWTLKALRSVKLGDLINDPPGVRDCTQPEVSGTTIGVTADRLGKYFCYHTSLGLPGRGRLVLQDASTGALSLDILTWTAP